MLGREPIDEEWADMRYVTKNYESVENAESLKGGEKNDGNGNTKNKNRFEVLNSANTEETDLYMYGSISAYSWYDGISSSKVREQLKTLLRKQLTFILIVVAAMYLNL